MIEDWKQVISTRAAEWGLPTGREWTFLFHNNYQPKDSAINLMWFYRNEQFPRLVTKMCRSQGILAREFQNLQAVHPLAPRFVPRPMHLANADGFGMLWMEGVPGHRIPPARRYSASMLTTSVDMLVSIHRALNRGLDNAATDRHARMVATPLEAVRLYGSPTVRNGCIALLETATATWLHSLPTIPQHGDLFLDNILCHREEFHVVDWENFGAIDLPFHDLLTLLLSFLRASAIGPDQWDADLKNEIPSLINRYARGLHLMASTVSIVLPLALVNWFYLHWIEGRAAATLMYRAIEHYFEHTGYWQKVFLGT